MRSVSLLGGLVLAFVLAGSIAAADTPPDVRTVAAPLSQVWCGPSTSDGLYPTNVLRQGDRVQVVEELPSGWLAIRPPAGSFSWINTRFLQHIAAKYTNYVVAYEGYPVPVLIGSSIKKDRPSKIGVKLPRGAQVHGFGLDAARTTKAPGCKLNRPMAKFATSARKTWPNPEHRPDLPSPLSRPHRPFRLRRPTATPSGATRRRLSARGGWRMPFDSIVWREMLTSPSTAPAPTKPTGGRTGSSRPTRRRTRLEARTITLTVIPLRPSAHQRYASDWLGRIGSARGSTGLYPDGLAPLGYAAGGRTWHFRDRTHSPRPSRRGEPADLSPLQRSGWADRLCDRTAWRRFDQLHRSQRGIVGTSCLFSHPSRQPLDGHSGSGTALIDRLRLFGKSGEPSRTTPKCRSARGTYRP